MNPGPQPLVVPFTEERKFINQRIGEEPGVVPAGEGVAVNVEEVFGLQGVEHVDVWGEIEVGALGVAVARVALAYTREVDIE